MAKTPTYALLALLFRARSGLAPFWLWTMCRPCIFLEPEGRTWTHRRSTSWAMITSWAFLHSTRLVAAPGASWWGVPPLPEAFCTSSSALNHFCTFDEITVKNKHYFLIYVFIYTTNYTLFFTWRWLLIEVDSCTKKTYEHKLQIQMLYWPS